MRSAIRVLIVDDSAFMRVTVARYLASDPAIDVVGSARDGLEALELVERLRPDVLTMDVEMPRMDGITALQRIMAERPTPVIMLSSRTQQGARTTIQALMRGAIDFVAKPDGSSDTRMVMAELLSKIKVAAGARPLAARAGAPLAPGARVGSRPFRHNDPLIVIGASAGGPRALEQVFADLPPVLPAAVVVVQHMPAGFTQSLAQRLNETYPFEIREAADGDQIARGLALLAPGDFHLRFDQRQRIALDRGPRHNHVRPSIDITMESAAARFGPAVIGVILTGMGSDGTAGAQRIKAAGGRMIAEHESSSIVYGMPRSLVEAGLADQVVALPDLAAAVTHMVRQET